MEKDTVLLVGEANALEGRLSREGVCVEMCVVVSL